MPDWITLIIIGVSIAVYALANLANAAKKPPQPGRPQEENAMARSRPSASEIDRFLEEVNRRKQQQQERRTVPPPVQQRREPRKPAAAPAPPPRPQKVTQRQVVLTEPVVQAVIVAEPVEPAARPIEALGPVVPLRVTQPLATREEPAHLRRAKSLLHSQEGMRTVFVINEILSPPRSQRPLRGTRRIS